MTPKLVVLLRGINVGGHKKVPMAELRELATGLGYEGVRTYIVSGNLLIQSTTEPQQVASDVSAALEKHFGFAVDVVVRTKQQWQEYAQGGVFPEAEVERANLVHLGLSQHKAPADAAETIRGYAKAGERVHVNGNIVWLDSPNGSGRSKITPKVLDRAFGGPVTCRNMKSVRKIAGLLEG